MESPDLNIGFMRMQYYALISTRGQILRVFDERELGF
jgi:hypothetical protein